MEDLSIFLTPTQLSNSAYQINQLGATVIFDFAPFEQSEWKQYDIAILGVKEDRCSENNLGCAMAPDEVRSFFYKLNRGNFHPRLVDLGNVTPGKTPEDTFFAVSKIVEQLLKNNVIPLVIGGSQALTYACYQGYKALEKTVNLISVDNQFDLGEIDESVNSSSYLSKIILHQPNYLFNFTNIGYQTYFVSQDSILLMEKLLFDIHRLGEVTSNVKMVEPLFRNADFASFDVSSVRMSDAPGNALASPNGFYGEEYCQMARYAGLSEKLTCVGFYETNPLFDNRGQTAHLVAQAIWCFVEGFYQRKDEFPVNRSNSNYLKFIVSILDDEHELVFYKSKKSDRWWMDVPYPPLQSSKYERHHIVPCDYEDYLTACKDEMPEKWFQTYKKLL